MIAVQKRTKEDATIPLRRMVHIPRLQLLRFPKFQLCPTARLASYECSHSNMYRKSPLVSRNEQRVFVGVRVGGVGNLYSTSSGKFAQSKSTIAFTATTGEKKYERNSLLYRWLISATFEFPANPTNAYCLSEDDGCASVIQPDISIKELTAMVTVHGYYISTRVFFCVRDFWFCNNFTQTSLSNEKQERAHTHSLGKMCWLHQT